MERLLATVPRTLIALVCIIVGFVLMRINDPPRTICDSQIELFKDSQKTFLYATTATGKSSLAREAYDICQADNSPGGCVEFFDRLRTFSADLANIPEQCSDKAAEEVQIQTWLRKSLTLMVQLAWGERAPASYNVKNGWFDASDLTLFCDLKRNAIRLMGSEMFDQWREQLLFAVPDAAKLTREQLWQKNLISTPCDSYR